MLPLVVPEGQEPEHEYGDKAAAPTAVFRHTFVSTEPKPDSIRSIRVTRENLNEGLTVARSVGGGEGGRVR
ncbi:hypothetical protein GCM10027258_12780 [Amycolatopsis stemonae]